MSRLDGQYLRVAGSLTLLVSDVPQWQTLCWQPLCKIGNHCVKTVKENKSDVALSHPQLQENIKLLIEPYYIKSLAIFIRVSFMYLPRVFRLNRTLFSNHYQIPYDICFVFSVYRLIKFVGILMHVRIKSKIKIDYRNSSNEVHQNVRICPFLHS